MNHPFERQYVRTQQDAVCKAYAAGLLAKSGTIIVYGTGADRGTWQRFANIEFRGHTTLATMEALSWFVDIHNHYHHNYTGHTNRHCRFCLTHLDDEVTPMLRIFGLLPELNEAILQADLFDLEHNLEAELKDNHKITDWQTRTFRFDLNVADRLETASYHAVTSVWIESDYLFTQGDASELLSNAFTAGLSGLAIGPADLAELMAGRHILARYCRPAPVSQAA